ncbi:SEN34 subunit of tRNA-splicing endonuclease [Xylona heveae TC161]|uniref:tRNA-splicing endonuclease subunit Sen34 n=1 Tax=Xylona heveae (strain CBS 132557 / TC161) TaxID=1328760 RepID=A0A161TBS4_XYLHT|nr:SEN34 subunit of tRNA-splicing endonuclease [Xylona heveae TC161]KZF23147.1 SEN34 subunit of tRNA-splicing endonuclease [Xylona heveae TC161]
MASKFEPFHISLVANRYFIHDVDVITYIRREHHICGVLLGSIPQIPQQNVFLGAPLELMPEEARLLFEKGAAVVVDDLSLHKDAIAFLPHHVKHDYLRDLRDQGMIAGRGVQKRTEERKHKALERLGLQDPPTSGPCDTTAPKEEPLSNNAIDSLPYFDAPLVYNVTPPLSGRILPPTDQPTELKPPKVPFSYPLYEFLHAKGYFISPGLRFGCQYLVYPGDPLRFHSHFLAVGGAWDEEMDLLDIVGGGRLGTGVKKGFLIGGAETEEQACKGHASTPDVRVFCVEWGGM